MNARDPFEFGIERAGFRDVPVNMLDQLPKEVRFVDVREPSEFHGDLGHLERAELVPLSTLGQASSQWRKDAPVLLICRSGNRSSQAASALARVGFTRLGNLAGGMLAVRAEGM